MMLWQKADLVITGEGSIDEQTLRGKGPFGVALRAREEKYSGDWPGRPGGAWRRMRHCDNILSSYWPSAMRPLNWTKPCRIQRRIYSGRQRNWGIGWL